MSAQELLERYPEVDMKYHLQNKSMWAGKIEMDVHPMSIFTMIKESNGESKMKIEHKTGYYSSAWFKTIDELIVNAADRCVNGQSNRIDVNFDGTEFCIKNNGPGFEVVHHPTVKSKDGTPMYVPEFLITTPFAGTEIKKKADSITGGTNGVGVKVVCASATSLRVVTIDPIRKYAFIQEYCEMTPTGPPEVIYLGFGDVDKYGMKFSASNPFTMFIYRPNYKRFKMEGSKLDINWLVSMINVRVHQIAVYCNTRVRNSDPVRNVVVTFNGKEIPIRSLADYSLLEMREKDRLITTTATDPTNNFPWTVSIVMQKFTNTKREPYNVAFINGVTTIDGGHIKHIRNHIINRVIAAFKSEQVLLSDDKEEKKERLGLVTELVKSSFDVHISGAIPSPSWDGQEKNKVGDSAERFKYYTIPDAAIKEITATISDIIRATMFEKEKKIIDDIRAKKEYIDPSKYMEATYAGPKRPSGGRPRVLFLSEGDSASTTLVSMLQTLKYGFDYYGVLSLRGVTMNVRKQIREYVDANGNIQLLPSRKLAENVIWKILMQVLNLDYNKKYDNIVDMMSLYYDIIIIATDQDLDGIGKISPILQSNFEKLWPGLFRQGIIKQLQTPQIIVTTKKGHKIEHMFYYDNQFTDWKNSISKKEFESYDITYCKGLGRIEDTSFPRIFNNLAEKILHIICDDDAHLTFDLFYDRDTEVRKDVFKKPLTWESFPVIIDNKVEASQFCFFNAIGYALDNMLRMQPNIGDGFPQARRMIIANCRKQKYKKPEKLTKIAADTTSTMAYAHGDGLVDTAVNMALYHSAARPIPFIIPHGQFGVRGKPEAAKPRYTTAELWTELTNEMFPPEDDDFLIYDESEGEIHEPRFYVSTDCNVIADFTNNPSSGYRVVVFPRAHTQRLRNIRRMIAEGPFCPLEYMPFNPNGFKGKYIRTEGGDEFMQGNYIVDSDRCTVRITELPTTISVDAYIKSLADLHEYILPPSVKDRDKLETPYVVNHSASDIDIKVKFFPGALNALYHASKPPHPSIDKLAHKLGLVFHMHDFINLINPDNGVSCYTTYEQPMRVWFQLRTQLWIVRQEREIIKLREHIRELENIIRYCGEYTQFTTWRTLKTEQAIALLTERNYDRINHELLARQQARMSNSEYVRLLREEGDYSYLLDMTDRQKLIEANERRMRELAEYRTLLAEYEADPERYKKIWLKHLDKLEYLYANRDAILRSHCMS